MLQAIRQNKLGMKYYHTEIFIWIFPNTISTRDVVRRQQQYCPGSFGILINEPFYVIVGL